MNANGRMILIFTRTATLFAMLFVVSGCSKTVSWAEEVKLSNGKTMTIERETRHRPGGGEIALNSGWRPELYIINFKHDYPPRRNLDIEWRTTKWDGDRVTDPELPLVMDMDPENRPFIITYHGLKGFCFEYIRYVYRDGGWYEDPLPDVFSPIEANLYLAAASLDMPGNVLLKEKKTVFDDFRYSKRFKIIGPNRKDCKA